MINRTVFFSHNFPRNVIIGWREYDRHWSHELSTHEQDNVYAHNERKQRTRAGQSVLRILMSANPRGAVCAPYCRSRKSFEGLPFPRIFNFVSIETCLTRNCLKFAHVNQFFTYVLYEQCFFVISYTNRKLRMLQFKFQYL